MMAPLRRAGIRQRSDKQAAKERDLAAAKPELMRRSGGRCELCLDGRGHALDPHHPYSRHTLGAWTNQAVCIVVACRPCHDVCTNPTGPVEHALAEAARKQVLIRLGNMTRLSVNWKADPTREALRLLEVLGSPA
jgi:hypothetical protein